jgi:uroporphyrinogen decarboxylase
MDSRSRVLSALNHQEPDKVPVDLAGHRASGISAIAYARLRDYMCLPKKPIRVFDIIQQLAVVDEDVRERFSVDTVELGRGFALERDHWVDWVLPDGTPCLVLAWALPERRDNGWILRSRTGRAIGQMPDGSLYFEASYYPFADGEPDLAMLEEVMPECMWALPMPPGPEVEGPGGDQRLADGARSLRATNACAVVGQFRGNLMEWGWRLFRIDNFFMMLASEPAKAHDLLERLTDLHMAAIEHYLSVVGPYIDVIGFGDDLGMQTGPQISPRMYREFFKPRHARMWKRAKELADVKVMLHCCGGVRPLLADLIDAGLDAINPVQISCTGMEAAGLKRDFGKDLTFWGGGCDTQRMLSCGTPAEIQDHVRRQIEIMQPGGGFVFQQVHNIQADVPPQNIVAMFDAANGCMC